MESLKTRLLSCFRRRPSLPERGPMAVATYASLVSLINDLDNLQSRAQFRLVHLRPSLPERGPMAVATYASLVSLINDLDNLQSRAQFRLVHLRPSLPERGPMAVATYASLVSLINDLDNLQSRAQFRLVHLRPSLPERGPMAVATYASLVSLINDLDNLQSRAQFRLVHLRLSLPERGPMAVATYASLVSLINDLDNLQSRAQFRLVHLRPSLPERGPMAVATYASLVSLINDLDNLQSRAQFRLVHLDINQIKTLNKNVHLLVDFVEAHSGRKGPEMEGLWKQISEVAAEAEDIIDLHVVNQLQHRSTEGNHESELSSFTEDMEKLIQKTDFINKDLLAIEELLHRDVQITQQPKVSVPAPASLATFSNGKNATVGLDEHVLNIVDQLTQYEPSLQILPIVGMGGIGKTTLARIVFQHPYIVGHFYKCIWLTISQEYNVQQILLGLLGRDPNNETNESLVRLGEEIHKKLYTERYLIVLDDVWSEKVWDDLQIFFPKNRLRSRVLITTRLSNVAVNLTSKDPYKLGFLNEEQSWDLLNRTVFEQEFCPSSGLEEIGKYIAKCCKGLPLAIVLIGRLLANSNMSTKYWNSVATNINSFRNLGDDEQCLKILSLSYDNLPIHLKPCFLYMRVFREDEKIDSTKLIRLWLAKGFIKPMHHQSLEEIAERYLQDLVDRNLVFVHESHMISRKIVSCGIHDLLRDLCLKETDKEHFMHSPRIHDMSDLERVCFLCRDPIKTEESIWETNLLKCDACEIMYSGLRLMRVMKDNDVAYPTKTRYLGISSMYLGISFSENLEYDCLSTLHLFWNLQTLIIIAQFSEIMLPQEIWEMLQLRHIFIHDNIAGNGVVLPEPVTNEVVGENFIIPNNLRTLHKIILRRPFTKAVADRLTNLMDLSVECHLHWSWQSVLDFTQLHRLVSLRVFYLSKNVTFPCSLRILKLCNCMIPWNEMTIVGSLPNLEELQLHDSRRGTEWNPVEGEFQKLKSLEIISCVDLKWWRADDTHFPVLQSLTLDSLESLEEIPSGFAYIDTLLEIKLFRCTDFVVNSAKRILEEQQDMGNQSLKLHMSDEFSS